MIEKMKKVHVVTVASHKKEMLDGLRDLGLVHLAERKSADPKIVEKLSRLTALTSRLSDFEPDKKSGTPEKPPVLSEAEFTEMVNEAEATLKERSALNDEIGSVTTEIERLTPWGDFKPEEVKELTAQGYDLHFYRLGKNECQAAMADPECRIIRLASVDNQNTIAVLGQLPSEIPATEFPLPERGLGELKKELEDSRNRLAECEEKLKKASLYKENFQAQMLKAENEESYSSASRTVEETEDLVWLSGYVPEADLESFKAAANANSWAYAVEDVSEDDDAIPTKLRYNKVSGLMQPIYGILGILPGYHEADVSQWFLIFFALFFAMILGDAGYGSIFLILAIVLTVKTKKVDTTIFLIYVLAITTIVWGALTGTWFGMKSAMNVPFLKALVLPGIANYPEVFGVDPNTQQNNVMKFCFIIGAIQMELGSLIAVKKKIGEKDLSFVANIGWMFALAGMFMLALYLVLGEKLAITPIFALIGIGFVLVLLFGGMAPGVKFSEGLKAGLGGALSTFLDTISCFGNMMSYIRLFAVGMAGLAIAQSFNSMAGGIAHGPMVVAAALVVIIGHALNLIMGLLSVVVHGVRLNVLEFSGQAGLEWTGIAYDPFKKKDKN